MTDGTRRVSFSGAPPPSKPQGGPFDAWSYPVRYELQKTIGKGAYGHVVEAFDKQQQIKVAVKRSIDICEDLVDCRRMLREVAILSELHHASIVRLLDFWCPEPLHAFEDVYMVMEICDSDLQRLLRSPIFLGEKHICTVTYHLFTGLKYLANCGIYHRDLKPANCLVNQDCSVKICDFGLARAVGVNQRYLGMDEEEEPAPAGKPGKLGAPGGGGALMPPAAPNKKMAKGLTGHVVTRWYRAPELILLAENYDEKIDIWSAGCILAELLQMDQGNGVQPAERAALFPGQTCFPLSPGKKSRRDKDMLRMICDLTGSPAEEALSVFPEQAQTYLRKNIPDTPPADLRKMFPASSKEVLLLLAATLQFDSRKRIAAMDAIESPCFDVVNKKVADGKADVKLQFEQDDLTEKNLRRGFLEQMEKFRDVKIPPELLQQ
jgi:mitogen-activated protein kinase 1/3